MLLHSFWSIIFWALHACYFSCTQISCNMSCQCCLRNSDSQFLDVRCAYAHLYSCHSMDAADAAVLKSQCAQVETWADCLPEEWYREQHRCENRKSQMNAVHIVMFIVLCVQVSPKNPLMPDAWCSTSRTATIYGETLFTYLISNSGECPSLLDVRDSIVRYGYLVAGALHV